MTGTATPSNLTELGLPGIRRVPYGVHMCHFYRSRDELVAALVPYFAAGLRARERCLWICAEPLAAAEAKRELARAGVDADAAIASGALSILDYGDWYAKAGGLKGDAVAGLWLAEEARALRDGYNGLRISGNATFLRDAAEWQTFMDYEATLNELFEGRRIVTLCTYSRERSGPAAVQDVIHRHNCTLDHPDEGWQMTVR